MRTILRLTLAVLLASALAGCAVLAPPPAAPPPPVDAWAAWQDGFRTAMDGCVAARGANCLALAFTAQPRPPIDNPNHSVSGDLFYDLRTAQAMLAVPNAVNALWSEYGIDNVAYLGTGHSVPVTATGPVPYWDAVQQEYFLPNLCAQAADPVRCPAADPDIWTWRLTVDQVKAALDEPIDRLLDAPLAQGDRKALAPRLLPSPKARADGLPAAFIRFGLIDAAQYKGTFGRPAARRVFFSDYAQLRSRTVRIALAGTGSTSLIAGAKPGQVFLVWVYAPGAHTRAAVASWHALFDALQEPPGR